MSWRISFVLGLVVVVALTGLVGRREGLDRGHQAMIGAMVNLDPDVAHFLNLRVGQAYRHRLECEKAVGRAAAPPVSESGFEDRYVGEALLGRSFRLFDEAKLLPEPRLVRFGQLVVQGVATVCIESQVEVGPVSLALDVGIDSGKWAEHGMPSLRSLVDAPTSWSILPHRILEVTFPRDS